MIRILIYSVIILTGFCLSPLVLENTGYIYIAVGDYQIETSLIFACACIVILYALFYLLEWLVVSLAHLLVVSRYLPNTWRQKSAKKSTQTGLLAIAEENWAEAEKNMARAASKGDMPMLNWLGAAQAAQQLQNFAARDEYLDALEKLPNTTKAAQVLRIRYFMEQQDFTKARVELEKLNPTSNSSAAVILLSLELYKQQADWHSLKLLLPIIKKKQLLTDELWQKLNYQVHTALLTQACEQGDQALEQCWHWFSRSEREDTYNIAIYTKGLVKFDQQAKALKLLRKHINQHSDKYIYQALSEVVCAADYNVFQQLNELADTQDNNPDYQYCMAMLNQRFREFKQAKFHWQQLCHFVPTTENWKALGKIQEQLGDSLGAIHSYRNALEAIK